MKIYLSALCLLSSCMLFRAKHEISITNNTNVTIDSVAIIVNDTYKFDLTTIPVRARATRTFTSTRPDYGVIYYVAVFVHDSLVCRKIFYPNDQESIPPEFGVIVTKDFKLELDTTVAP